MVTALRHWYDRGCRRRLLRRLIEQAPTATVRDDLKEIAARDAANR